MGREDEEVEGTKGNGRRGGEGIGEEEKGKRKKRRMIEEEGEGGRIGGGYDGDYSERWHTDTLST